MSAAMLSIPAQRTITAASSSSAYSAAAAPGWYASTDSLHPPVFGSIKSEPHSDSEGAGDGVTVEECKARAREERQKRRASSVCRSDTGEASTQTSPLLFVRLLYLILLYYYYYYYYFNYYHYFSYYKN